MEKLHNSVATVDVNGRVTGAKAGTTFIEARAYNGKIAGPMTVIMVTVQDGVKGVSLDSFRKDGSCGQFRYTDTYF